MVWFSYSTSIIGMVSPSLPAFERRSLRRNQRGRIILIQNDEKGGDRSHMFVILKIQKLDEC
jgi:hypothetical protein